MSLRHTILGFLSIQPMTGYDLKRYFDASVRHFWSADQAAIYRTLGELERDAMVDVERVAQATRPDRKVYSLTDNGRYELDRWLATPAPQVPRREPLLVKLFFAGRLSDAALRALLEAELAAAEAELEGYRQITASIHADAGTDDEATLVGPLITLTNGVQSAIAQRDWLQGLLSRHVARTLTASALLAEIDAALRDADAHGYSKGRQVSTILS